jgi:excisionase family DNA binding protein
VFMELPFRNLSWSSIRCSELVIHTNGLHSSGSANTWQSRSMVEEWMLTVADVAEVLGTSRERVAGLIARDELRVVPGRKIRVTHTAVAEFVASRQRDALMLGQEPDFAPSILGLRPAIVIDEHNPDG